jgi:photosystem II stability/assembly factor-like uncharacterized protein
VAVRGKEALVALFRGHETGGGALLRTSDGGESWDKVLTSDGDLYRVAFADAQRGWATGSGGALWTTDGGEWKPGPDLGSAAVGCLAFAPGGSRLGLAPLWQGKALQTKDGLKWDQVSLDLGYSMPDAAVVDDGWAIVLGADGRLSRYVDPAVPPRR